MSTKKILIASDKIANHNFEFQVQNDSYTHDGKDLKIEVETTADGFSMMKVNGISYPVEIVSQHQNEYELLVNGVSYFYSLETPFSLKRQKLIAEKANESTVIRLKAPMPGKILEVLVKTGDIVKAGDTLVVLEAMKMQNAILASTKGIIKKVLVKEGDTTSKSDLLIELERD